MEGTIILDAARKAILARLATLERHFSQDDINEMVSMTVERFYTRGAYDPARASVRTYVSRIAVNVVFDFIKAVDRDRSLFRDFDTLTDPLWLADKQGTDSELLDRERDELFGKAVGQLTPRQQELLALYMEELPYKEIAALTGGTAGNVAVEVHRLKSKMRSLLQVA